MRRFTSSDVKCLRLFDYKGMQSLKLQISNISPKKLSKQFHVFLCCVAEGKGNFSIHKIFFEVV